MIKYKLILALLIMLFVNKANADIDFSTSGFIAPTIAFDTGANLGNTQSSKYSLTQSIAGVKNILITDYVNVSSFIDITSTNVNMHRKFQLRYLMLDKAFNFDTIETGIRLGRIKHKYGFYGSYYNEPTLTEFIYLPQAIYRDTFNGVATGGDGIQFYYNVEVGNNIISSFIGVSKPNIANTSKEIIATQFFSNQMGQFNPNSSLIYDGNFSLSNTKTNTTYNLDIVDLSFSFTPSNTISVPNYNIIPNPLLGSNHINTKILTMGIRQYFDNGLDITGEYVCVTNNGNAWDKASSLYGLKPPHGYLLSLRKVTEKFTISLTTDGYVATDNKQVPVMLGMNDWSRYTYTYSLSGMYKLNASNLIKAQFITGEGTNTLIQALNMQSSKYWRASVLQYVHSF